MKTERKDEYSHDQEEVSDENFSQRFGRKTVLL